MKTHHILASIGTAVVTVFVGAMIAYAALVPTLTINSITGSASAQVTVFGADPNAPVTLMYPGPNSYQSTNIGTTNQSGYLTLSINPTTYNIASAAPVYVSVNGQSSPSVQWPSYTSSSGSLSLSQNNISLNIGQSVVVSASVSSALSVSNNSNATAVGVMLSGNQLTVTGFAYGTSNITVCAQNIGCSVLYVTVQNSNSVSSISFSPSSVTVGVGQSATVQISGSGSYYVSTNSNNAVANTSVNGSVLTVTGISVGTGNLSVCTSSGLSSSCGTVNVTVSPSYTPTPTPSSSSGTIFSQSEVDMNVRQTQNISLNGTSGGIYYVTNNSATSVVTANVSGNSLVLTAIASGGANLTVCQMNGGCGNLYVYVMPAGVTQSASASVAASTAASNPTAVTTTSYPTITSFTVSSNNRSAGFAATGNMLSFSIMTNISVNTPTITVADHAVTVTGSGTGPYVGTYTTIGTEGSSIPVSIAFTAPSGVGTATSFSIGTGGSASSVTPPATPTNTAAVSTGSGVASASFNRYLYMGMTASGVSDPDVLKLQTRLKNDGLFSGPLSGYFGPATKAALEAYQTKNGLKAIGVVGPSTRALLNQGI